MNGVQMKLHFANQLSPTKSLGYDVLNPNNFGARRSVPVALTREALQSGAYLDSFISSFDAISWSVESIEESLEKIMQQRPGNGDVWIFAYGSLMWNPLLNFDRRQVATLNGWHRSFCLRMTGGRANPTTPGRMLALEPGGVTEGLAYRLSPYAIEEELRLVWIREMATGFYQPIWTKVKLADGTTATAIAFVADPVRPQYEKDAGVLTVAPLVASATGSFGTNADYVLKLEAALADSGLRDAYVEVLSSEMKRLSPVGSA